jgi:hypothetical protein
MVILTYPQLISKAVSILSDLCAAFIPSSVAVMVIFPQLI